MGIYLNPDTMGFRTSLNSQIYVDKSLLIAETNRRLNTEQKFMCVSRPRRFGKSMAMNMLSAYYSCGQDARSLFEGLKICKEAGFDRDLNRYNVLKINMQQFLSSTKSVDTMLEKLKKYIIYDILEDYSNVRFRDSDDFFQVQMDVCARTGTQFIILIDEWDCLFREYKDDKESQRTYLDFLRNWLKDQNYVALAYMTGILPVKKYGTHSALNMFTEYSMTDPGELAPYFGFTEDEVRALCDQYQMSFEDTRAWYDGYSLLSNRNRNPVSYAMYSPKSVVEAMLRGQFGPYWNQTETYEALRVYILMNIDGLKDKIVQMMSGQSVPVDISGFDNDMTTFAGADDVLTLLIHLGYLTYDSTEKTVSIPNREVAKVYVTSVERMDHWSEVAQSIRASKKLLEALWEKDGEAVAAGIEQAHNEISILKYNDENSLSCCIQLAFYYAKEYYNVYRELPAGKGFADVVFVPRHLHADKPAVVVELKVDKTAKGAIDQIKEKNYCNALKDYHGKLLLCGINYDRETKTHTCWIEDEDDR